MNTVKLIFISTLLVSLGVLFFLHQDSWIIFNFPNAATFQLQKKVTIQSKETPLWIFKQGSLKKETTEIIFSNNQAQTIKQLLNNWLIALEEENIINKQIVVQSVILSPSGQDAFICMTESPLPTQASTHTKLTIIESMLKTLKDAKLDIASVRLLVHHEPLRDAHLNFNISWPIHGYQY